MQAPAEVKKVLFCAVHGPVEADRALSSRGHRFRCPVEACGRWLSAHAAEGKREVAGSASLPVAVTADPEIVGLVKEREKAKLEGEILGIRGYMKRLGALETQMVALNERVKQVSEHVDHAIAEVNTENQELWDKLDGILTANLKADFTCKKCGATELVAVHIQCTKCKAEDWWGWQPE